MALVNLPPINDGEDATSALFNARFAALTDALNGGIDTENLSAGAVATTNLADKAVTTAKLDDYAVTDQKWSNTICFRARRSATYNTPANAATSGFNFDAIDYNQGNHYNATSGLFTAPVRGVYEFKVSFFTETVLTTRAFIVVRGTIAAHYKTRNFDGSANSVNRCTSIYEVYMNAGENIGFDVWTSASNNLANTETWLTGHIVTRLP